MKEVQKDHIKGSASQQSKVEYVPQLEHCNTNAEKVFTLQLHQKVRGGEILTNQYDMLLPHPLHFPGCF